VAEKHIRSYCLGQIRAMLSTGNGELHNMEGIGVGSSGRMKYDTGCSIEGDTDRHWRE